MEFIRGIIMHRYYFIVLLLFLFACQEKTKKTSLQEQYNLSAINLIPDDVVKTFNSWMPYQSYYHEGTSNYSLSPSGDGNHTITYEQQLFGDNGYSSFFLKAVNDMYVVLPYGRDLNSESLPTPTDITSSFLLNTSSFPSCDGSIVEALTCLNQLSKGNGFSGAGVWVPLFDALYFESNTSSLNPQRDYYAEMLDLSAQSGISYWKTRRVNHVDPSVIRLLSAMAEERAPDLILEYNQQISPLNDYVCPWDTIVCHNTGTFSAWGDGVVLNQAVGLAEIRHVFYTGDVTSSLFIPTTLERIAQLLVKFNLKNTNGAVLNCGDAPYMAAALGCAMQIKRHPLNQSGSNEIWDIHRKNYKLDAVFRALRWQRVAPIFPIGKSSDEADPWRLEDNWVFNENAKYDWLIGEQAIQKAPGRISRGMPLPEIKDTTEYAYAVATRYPNGATAIATLPRVDPERGVYHPLNDISIQVDEWDKPIGVFGNYNSLTIHFDRLPALIKVWGQDLAGSRAIDITDYVDIQDNNMVLSGELIHKAGTLAASKGDLSDPGMLIQIEGIFK